MSRTKCVLWQTLANCLIFAGAYILADRCEFGFLGILLTGWFGGSFNNMTYRLIGDVAKMKRAP